MRYKGSVGMVKMLIRMVMIVLNDKHDENKHVRMVVTDDYMMILAIIMIIIWEITGRNELL